MEGDLTPPALYRGPASVSEWTRIVDDVFRRSLPYEEEEFPMKVSYTTENGRLTFEAEVPSGKAAFELLGKIQELFEEPKCGCCQSESIRCSTREHDGNMFYNLVCNGCGAQLDIGQRKDGKGMWLKRTDKDGNKMDHNGWYIYGGQRHNQSARQTSVSRQVNDDSDPGDSPF